MAMTSWQTTLETGKRYNVDALQFAGWTAGDGSGAEGYSILDYFADDGTYKGADQHGIEPIFDTQSVNPLTDDETTTVCGHQIQHDPSGQGHAWRNIDRDDIPAGVRMEIEGEIIDGKRDSGELVASNGLHYRW